MKGKTCVVTGATSGIGRVTALELGRRGARLVLVCRDRAKAAAVAAEIGGAEVVVADLSVQADVRRAAAEVLALCPRLDVLVNNAGALFQERRLTADGLESTFAVNHLAYFLLTLLLLERLKAGGPARVVNVASDAHRPAKTIPFDDLDGARSYSAVARYSESKLANILFTRELARRLEGTQVTANSLHPGGVATGFAGQTRGLLGLFVRLVRPFMLTPEEGARTVVWLASAPEAEGLSGRYFAKCREKRPTRAALDDALARRLWDVSEKLTARS